MKEPRHSRFSSRSQKHLTVKPALAESTNDSTAAKLCSRILWFEGNGDKNCNVQGFHRLTISSLFGMSLRTKTVTKFSHPDCFPKNCRNFFYQVIGNAAVLFSLLITPGCSRSTLGGGAKRILFVAFLEKKTLLSGSNCKKMARDIVRASDSCEGS